MAPTEACVGGSGETEARRPPFSLRGEELGGSPQSVLLLVEKTRGGEEGRWRRRRGGFGRPRRAFEIWRCGVQVLLSCPIPALQEWLLFTLPLHAEWGGGVLDVVPSLVVEFREEENGALGFACLELQSSSCKFSLNPSTSDLLPESTHTDTHTHHRALLRPFQKEPFSSHSVHSSHLSLSLSQLKGKGCFEHGSALNWSW